MPYAPKVLCRGGCGRPVVRGVCEACQAKGVGQRKSSTQRGYDYRWQRARAAFLQSHPLCGDPYMRHPNQVVLATDVDHRIAHKGDMTLFWDPANWQGLCHDCHSYTTALEDGGFGR